ncbi:hypothetical protein [Flammeovirga kamogawensis]|uniref:Organic solvent tolerance-like N-terminal domain-containing protein n=1 Tax=Flammeovirga kamogawensis TaxID=373891 RepID=A0ABX8GUI5_9BACT|nr:hypothetical protein [Flammeovirga kamogawensis]MBB6460056.1 hypothetical protein [Flammeovirga kamogawensis]QWG06897.1 hypothetical protein KM029_16545 [Flammeovirga kamogawensis]TRX68718.1 hypothetical protein EO216_11540 [Flammeovirga kamogawensis]
MRNLLTITLFFSFLTSTSAQFKDKVTSLFIKKNAFTIDDKNELEYMEADLSKVVFYTSQEISLKRLVSTDSTVKENAVGDIIFENGDVIDRLVIKKGATGFIHQINEDTLLVKFENIEGRYLTFVSDKRNMDTLTKYYLFVDENRRVAYNNQEWDLLLGNNVCIQWKSKSVNVNKESSHTVKGLRADGSQKKTFKESILGK